MKTNQLVKTGLMLALALVFQIGFRSFAQPLVGPLVNMTLILTVIYVGTVSGVIVGTVTPLVAFILGLMPMVPLVPVIAIGNALLVVMFGFSLQLLSKYKWHSYMAVVISAVFKFTFLYVAVRAVLPLFLEKVPAPIVAAFGIAQLYTALAGGLVAVLLMTFLPMKKNGEA